MVLMGEMEIPSFLCSNVHSNKLPYFIIFCTKLESDCLKNRKLNMAVWSRDLTNNPDWLSDDVAPHPQLIRQISLEGSEWCWSYLKFYENFDHVTPLSNRLLPTFPLDHRDFCKLGGAIGGFHVS